MEENNNAELINAINILSENQVATNNSIKELQEYFILKDKKEQKEKEEAEQTAKAEAELKAEQEEKDTKDAETKEAEQTAKAEETTQTYTEQLQSINTQIEATNGMIAGQYVTDGVLCGALLLTILWNKLN